MSEISVGQLARDNNLRSLTPDIDADEIILNVPNINRPALQLAGFFDHFDSHRVQIIGNVETAYVATLSREQKIYVFDKMFSFNIPCLVYCRNHMPDEDVLELARKYSVPLLASRCNTSDVFARMLRYLQETLAPTLTIHGVLMDIFGEGVLITGESGIGKSEAALELIKRGHRLVADDAVELRKITAQRISGTSPDNIRHFLELRGIGIINARRIFGMGAIKSSVDVDLIVNLELWDDNKVYDRMGMEDHYTDILGVQVPSITIPVKPGRNIAVILEVAAMNYREKKLGYNAAHELLQRLGMMDIDTNWDTF